jgi:hypothetical protein
MPFVGKIGALCECARDGSDENEARDNEITFNPLSNKTVQTLNAN